MKKFICILLAICCLILMTACGKEQTQETKSDDVEEEPVSVEEMLQGTWDYYDAEIDFGEQWVFDNGKAEYTAYAKADRSADHTSTGTYEILDDTLKITIGDNVVNYYEYYYEDGELKFSWIIDGGIDAGSKRVYTKVSSDTSDN